MSETTETPDTTTAAEPELPAESAELTPQEAQAKLAEELKAIIDVQSSDVGVLRKALVVTVPAERIEKERDEQYSALINDALVPGFRRGRAPRSLVEKRYGREIGDQVLSKLVSNSCMAAIDKQGIKALGDPLFRVKVKQKEAAGGARSAEIERDRLLDITEALEHMRLPAEGPLSFTCEVEVKPDFELPPLEGIPVKRPKVAINEDDVSAQIKRMRALSGELVPVADGAVEADDMVIADVAVTVGGQTVVRRENEALYARPRNVCGVTIENLGDVLKGARTGETRTTDATLAEDFEQQDYRGKQATIEFKVNDIKRLNIPPLDDAALKDMGFDSEQEYRDFIRRRMEHQLEDEIKSGMRGQVCRHLLEHTKLDLPEGLSARQVERAVVRRVLDLRRRGVPQAEIDKHADELRTSARDQALNELKLYFIIEKIAEQQEIEVREEEINARIAAIARQYNQRFDRVRDQLAGDGGLESLYLQLRDDKCLDKLLEKAAIEEAAGPATSQTALTDAT